MRRAITPLFAIAMSAALIGGTAATSQAASRAGQQCGNFFECLFGGLNNNNSPVTGPEASPAARAAATMAPARAG
jgi:ABC-type uncharacterized transport system substrate-binding protein